MTLNSFLEHGANANIAEYYGQLPLHFAVATSLEMTKLVIKYTKDVNVVSKSLYEFCGATPLHYLIKRSTPDLEILKLLLDNGADVCIKDKCGKTASEYYDVDDEIKELIKC